MTEAPKTLSTPMPSFANPLIVFPVTVRLREYNSMPEVEVEPCVHRPLNVLPIMVTLSLHDSCSIAPPSAPPDR